MEKKELSELLKRYQNGNTSLAENQLLETWFDSSSAAGSLPWTESEKSEVEKALKLKIDAQISDNEYTKGGKKWIWAATASILLIMTVGIVFYKAPNGGIFLNQVSYNETVTQAGEKLKITLSDGSSAFLNGSTKIRYPKSFNVSNREVILVEGEVLFDVKHNKNKPFIVKTNGASIRVLGTSFNVKSYHNMLDTRVAVLRGKVAVNETGSSNRHVLLLPDEQVIVNKRSGDLQKSHINSNDISGWTEGKLIFDNESLENIAETLHHTKNITIHFASNDLKAIRSTAGFDVKETPDDIISALSRANGLSYTIQNNDVFLSRKGTAIR